MARPKRDLARARSPRRGERDRSTGSHRSGRRNRRDRHRRDIASPVNTASHREGREVLRIMHLRNTTGLCGIYGADQCILSWVDEMRREGGIDFFAGCFVGEGEKENHFAEALRRRGVAVETIAMRHYQSAGVVRRLAAFIRRHQVDLIHTHESRSNILGFLAARLAGIPAVTTVHGFTRQSWSTAFFNVVNLLFLRFAPFARLMCVSDAMRRDLVRRWRLPRAMITVQNGIAPPGSLREESRNDLRRELGIREREKLVGTVGRLSYEKGQRFLLEAVPLVRAEHPRTVFVLAGDGPDRDLLERRAAELDSGCAVRFLGYRRDVSRIMRALDLLVVPSLKEGISIALLEGMSRGVPAVASRAGGIPEVVVHGQTGIMVPPADPRCLASAISSLLEQEELAREMGRQGEHRVREEFSVARTAAAIRRVYLEARGKKARAVHQ